MPLCRPALSKMWVLYTPLPLEMVVTGPASGQDVVVAVTGGFPLALAAPVCVCVRARARSLLSDPWGVCHKRRDATAKYNWCLVPQAIQANCKVQLAAAPACPRKGCV